MTYNDNSLAHKQPTQARHGEQKVQELALHILQGGHLELQGQQWDMGHVFAKLYQNQEFIQAMERLCDAHVHNDIPAHQQAVQHCRRLTLETAEEFVSLLLNPGQ